MGDHNKNKPPNIRPNTNRVASNSGTSSLPSSFGSRSETQVLLAQTSLTNPTPTVLNAVDARKWLFKKTWITEDESISRLKLADILFNIASQIKSLPPDFQAAIMSVAYLIEDQAEDVYASAIGEKITAKLFESISNINSALIKSKEYIDATTTQQASAILNIQEAATKQSEIIEKLATTTDKITATAAANPRNLTSNNWPFLSSNAPSKPSVPSAHYNSKFSAEHVKIQQRLILSSLQVFIETDKDNTEAPKDRSIPAQRQMRDNVTKSFQEAAEAASESIIPSPKAIRSTQVFERSTVLLEFETK